MDEIEKIVKDEINQFIYAFGSGCFNVENQVLKSDAEEIIANILNYFKKGGNSHDHDMKSFCYDHERLDVLSQQVANCSLDSFFEDETDDCISTDLKNQEIAIHEIVNESSEDNVQYIGDVLSILDEIEKKSPQLPSDLQEVLFDEDEHSSEYFDSEVTDSPNKDQLSDDSGIYSDNSSNDSSPNEKDISGADNNNICGPVKLNPNTLDAIDNILEKLKEEIDINTEKVVNNWKKSLIEYNCSLICKLSLKGTEYEAAVQNFIVDLLNDIWSDGQMNQHANWMRKVSIICNFLTTPSICLEVLFFTIDIFSNVNAIISKGCCTSLVIVKIALFLEIYPIVARRLHLLLRPLKRTHDKTVSVTKLWQEKLSCIKHVDNYHQEVTKMIQMDIIPNVVRFLSCLAGREPLVALAAKEALDKLKNLCDE